MSFKLCAKTQNRAAFWRRKKRRGTLEWTEDSNLILKNFWEKFINFPTTYISLYKKIKVQHKKVVWKSGKPIFWLIKLREHNALCIFHSAESFSFFLEPPRHDIRTARFWSVKNYSGNIKKNSGEKLKCRLRKKKECGKCDTKNYYFPFQA